MESGVHGVSSFFTQADALLRKNLAFQKRNIKQNIGLIFFPAFLCLLIITIQHVVLSQLSGPRYKCGCQCVDKNQNGSNCRKVCGLEYSSTLMQASACPIPRPKEWPALMQIPAPQYQAVRTDSHSFPLLPNKSCRKDLSCPATSLFTGQNKTIAESLVRQIYKNVIPWNVKSLSDLVPLSYLGTHSSPGFNNFIESAFMYHYPLELVLPYCPIRFNITVPIPLQKSKDILCMEGLHVWRENSSSINTELFQGYSQGNPAKEIHGIVGAYDFLNTSKHNFNVSVWYNSTYRGLASNSRLLRIPRSLNMVSNAFISYFGGGEMRVLLSFVKEMPKPENRISLHITSVIGPLLYAWVIQLLLPVFLASLVYEKQHKLRTMMKLHGLRDGPYWVITYSYFLFISSLYMIWFAAFGYIIGLDIFRLNSYAVQLIFYLLYLNLQITLAFLAGNGFSEVKTAAVVAYMYVFGSGLLGDFLFKLYIEDTSFSRWNLMIMELIPGFSLYRGLYELQQYALSGSYRGTMGMRWEDLCDQNNGMKGTLIIITSEWLILLCIAYLLEQVIFSGKGVQRRKIRFLTRHKKTSIHHSAMSNEVPSSAAVVDHEFPDLHEERYKVEQLLIEPSGTHPIVCHNLKKVYIGKDGTPNKNAVHSLSLSVPRGECFGLLGPSGSGKTTFINMMTGFLLPTSGTAFINNMDIRSAMNQIQTKIGVCPQQDVIWESLTGREHLLFYGRLRNLKGAALKDAVEESLRNFNLYEHNVGDKLTGGYSGGMKRRLGVAISIIGETQVVFLDEPTTGLDIESRNHLWNVVKQAKVDRAIVLTKSRECTPQRTQNQVSFRTNIWMHLKKTSYHFEFDFNFLKNNAAHSMEEAEFLCDRLGIIVDGRLQCLGNSKELKARYGRSHLFTISVNPHHKKNVEQMVARLSPNAVKNYDVGGTQKFQLPKRDVRICDVFEAVDKFKSDIPIYAFGLNGSSMEDVFTNVVDEAVDI